MGKFIDLVIRGKDLFSSKSDKAADSIGSLKTEIKDLDKQLKQTEATQESIQIFEALSAQSVELSQALDESKASLVAYTQAQVSSATKLEKTSQSVDELKQKAKELTATYKTQSSELNKSEASLTKASAKMRDYASTLESSEAAIKSTNAQYAKQKQSLVQLEQEYKNSKKPVDDLNNSYKVAKAQLTALEQVQKKQVSELEKTKAGYQQSADEVQRMAAAQSELKTAVQGSATTLSQVNTELVELKAAQLSANQELEASTRSYKAAAKATETFEKNLKTVNGQLNKTESSLKAAEVDTNNLGAATTKLANKQKDLVAQTKKAFTALAKMSSQLSGMKKGLNTFGNSVGSVTGQLLAMGGTYIGIRSLWTSLKQFVSVGAQFDTFRKQFQGIMGSVSEGEQAFEWVKEFARNTPLDMEQVTQAFIVLKGAGLDPMDGSLAALTDSTAKYTGGTAKLENITRQLAQAWAKGKISAEDMKTATENGLPAWTLLATATGKSVGELRNLSEQGKLGRYELRLLFAEMKNDAPGAAAELMKTFNGQMAIARFNVQDFLDTVAQSGALDFLLEKLTGLNEQVTAMAADGSLKVFAQEMSDRFVEIAKSVSTATKSIFTDLQGFSQSVTTSFATITLAANLFTGSVRVIISSFAALIKVATYGFSQLTSVFGLFPNAVSEAALSLANFAKAMEDTATAQAKKDYEELKAALEQLKGGAESAADGIKSVNAATAETEKTVKPLGDALNATGSEALSMAENMLKLGTDIKKADLPADRLKATIEALVDTLKDDPSPYVQQIVKRLKQQYTSLGDTIKGETDKSKKTLEELEQSFKNVGGKTLDNLKENVANALEVFAGFSEAQKPVNELRAAFLSLLAAEEELAKAKGTTLSSTLAATAAQLGLSDAFNESNGSVERHNAVLNGTVDVYDSLINRQSQVSKGHATNTAQLAKQASAQANLTQKENEAASSAGANVAFQKLWNEARERSVQLYNLMSLSTAELTERTKKLGDELSGAFRNQSWSNILKPINDLNNAAKQNEINAIAQTKAYKALFAELENGTVSAKQLNYYARESGELFNQLDQTNLSALQSQIDRAKQATVNLKDELIDTVHDLKNELDELEGNQSKVLERDYQANKLELEAKLKAAEKSKDRDAIEAARETLDIARQIYQIKSKNIQADIVTTQKTVSENNNNNTTTNIKQTTQVQEIRYTVTLKAGNSAATFTGGGNNVESFLKALADQGFTVTRS